MRKKLKDIDMDRYWLFCYEAVSVGNLKGEWRKLKEAGVIVGLILTKACNVIWPDTPVVVKELADTVKVIHLMSPLQVDTDSIIRKQIEQQLMDIELLNKYNTHIVGKREAAKADVCKIVAGNPYPNSRGYSTQSASSYCYIKQSTK